MISDKYQDLFNTVCQNDKKGPYSCFFINSPLFEKSNLGIRLTSDKGQKPTSLMFAPRFPKIASEEDLNRIFGTSLGEKYQEAANGEGDEKKRLGVLHSSSLCALLLFSNVSEAHPLTMTINGAPIAFSEVHFEFENTVFKDSKPSSIDVVLIDKGKKNVLFLESKFSEYFHGGRANVSEGYKNKYKELGITIDDNKSDEGWHLATECIRKDKLGKTKKCIDSNGNPCYQLAHYHNKKDDSAKFYCGGLKQMISHSIGVKNYIAGAPYPETKSRKINGKANLQYKDLNHPNVYLGTILFDFESKHSNDSESSSDQRLACYCEEYERLIEKITKEEQVTWIIKKPFLYRQDVLWNKNNKDYLSSLSREIVDFYQLSQK